jgi:hypothetical protein
MAGGLFSEDCSTWYGSIDPGCILQAAGSDIGSSVTSTLEPVFIILGIAIVILLIIAFAPNVKHIVPAFL